MGRFGIAELAIILAIFVLLFGAKRLPALADGMGKAIRNFKKGLNTDEEIDVTPSDKQVSQTASAATLDDATSDAQTVEQKS